MGIAVAMGLAQEAVIRPRAGLRLELQESRSHYALAAIQWIAQPRGVV